MREWSSQEFRSASEKPKFFLQVNSSSCINKENILTSYAKICSKNKFHGHEILKKKNVSNIAVAIKL